ncbi:MAG: hypothetical protein C0403_09720 [Desulfobacterium sp.]|nr:hypothetical protein [Desulfobacterium sp.]
MGPIYSFSGKNQRFGKNLFYRNLLFLCLFFLSQSIKFSDIYKKIFQDPHSRTQYLIQSLLLISGLVTIP